MTVLVTAASKHGATIEIARAIGETIRDAGLDVVVAEPAAVRTTATFEAVVIGSGVYVGHWLEPALELTQREGSNLGERPVWLFSSGPVGEPLKPEGNPVDVEAIVEGTGARDHRIFGGRIDKGRLGFGERALCAALRVPEGDFRPWPEIRAWARDIAAAIKAGTTGGWERPVAVATGSAGDGPRRPA